MSSTTTSSVNILKSEPLKRILLDSHKHLIFSILDFKNRHSQVEADLKNCKKYFKEDKA